MTSDEPQPVDWEGLNRDLYSGDPAGYFRYRLNMLMLAAGRADDVERLLLEGVRYEGLVSHPIGRSAEELGDLHLAYLITESQALLHHVSEALLRLFFAHAVASPCPWLEVARLRNFALFKERVSEVAEYRWPEGLDDAVWPVFLGNKPEAPSDEQVNAQAAIVRLLRHLASALIEDSNLYNSVKHGMAIIASEAYFGITDDETGQGFGHQGPSVAFLESTVAAGLRTWKITTRWVSIRKALWLAQLAMMEIDALWAIARSRYLGSELDGVHVVTPEAVEDGITGAFADLSGVTSFSRNVAVE